jgi:hypothetical protein
MTATNFWYGTSAGDYGTGVLFNADGSVKITDSVTAAASRSYNAALYYYSATIGATGSRPATGA